MQEEEYAIHSGLQPALQACQQTGHEGGRKEGQGHHDHDG
jgi:hypothetical protein